MPTQVFEVVTTSRWFGEIDSRFRAIAPFLEFLNAPLTVKRKKVDGRELFG